MNTQLLNLFFKPCLWYNNIACLGLNTQWNYYLFFQIKTGIKKPLESGLVLIIKKNAAGMEIHFS
ncbi:MAG: hypothetical protein EOO07_37715 [Chitinophagaceae bacterium]|nr:MAG: hypothetical protein EOO07_37715 [Chitinophagaceae bacterium]